MSQVFEEDLGAMARTARVLPTPRTRRYRDLGPHQVPRLLGLVPVHLGDQLRVGAIPRGGSQAHLMGEKLDRKTADTLRSSQRAAFGGCLPALLVGGADAHPVTLEILLAHSLSVVRDADPVPFEQDLAPPGIGVIGILHELREGDIVLADKALAELAQQGSIDGKGYVLLCRHGRRSSNTTDESRFESRLLP